MSSQRKIDSARANGAKSRGPKTEAGRKISSMNAVQHGLYSSSVVLKNESPAEYQEMLQAYIQQFQPAGPVEFHLIDEMVAAKWRQHRLWAIEAQLLETETADAQESLDETGETNEPIEPLSRAYRSLANFPVFPFLIRNESRLERAYSRALKSLLELQRLRKSANQNVQERTQISAPAKPHQPPAPSPPIKSSLHLPMDKDTDDSVALGST